MASAGWDPLRRQGRKVVARLPDPAQRMLRELRDRRRASSQDATPAITYPPDVVDIESLRSRLAQTDLFDQPAEGEGYLADAIERFRLTMSFVPPVAPGARVLELGSNPYFITRLLRERGLDVTSANWFGEGNDQHGLQVVTESGVVHEYHFDHFNLERAAFPYADASFDLVLFCEILEHLPCDPVHALAEIHRILKPGGAVLITTPNASRAENLVKSLRGDNVYEVLSGYGTYGRHNREYTVGELRGLLELEGYEVEFVVALDIHPDVPVPPRCLHVGSSPRGENLFALGRAVGAPRWRYPEWLFTSRHALRRTVRADVEMGYNDEVQSAGLHVLEDATGRPYRWTGDDEAHFWLRNEVDGGRLRIEGFGPPVSAPSVRVCAAVGDRRQTWDVAAGSGPFVLDADLGADPGPVELTVGAGPTWRPVDIGVGGDGRRLGVALTRIAFILREPAATS